MDASTLTLGLSPSSLMAGLIFGIIGMWMFRDGKKRGNMYTLGIGIALMIYPYFTHTVLADWGIGIGLCGLAKYFWHEVD